MNFDRKGDLKIFISPHKNSNMQQYSKTQRNS